MDMTALETLLYRAIYDVIEEMGLEEFKKSSLFASAANEKFDYALAA